VVVTGPPVWMVAPLDGAMIAAGGAVVSAEAVARGEPDWSVTGRTPMSASRFTVASRCARRPASPHFVDYSQLSEAGSQRIAVRPLPCVKDRVQRAKAS
jgi:hypothetical protein